MKLTFLKSPSDIKSISLSKGNDRMYIKKDLLEYLNLDITNSGQISVAKTDDGKIVLMDNPYYNNFRYTIPKSGNPFISVKGSFDDINSDFDAIYELETRSIGDRENVPLIIIEWKESINTLDLIDNGDNTDGN